MKEYKKKLIVSCIVTLIPMAAGILLWNRLPDTMATHFGMDNVPNGWSSKPFTVFGLPAFLVTVHLLTIWATLNDPKKQNIGQKMFTFLFWIVPAISCIVGLCIYGYALELPVNIEKITFVLIGVVFLVIGNYMSKNRQNYTVGIKIPWTLNSTENWNRTHRMASKLWIGAGILFLCNIFLEIGWLILGIIAVMVVLPIGYSFLLYKKGI